MYCVGSCGNLKQFLEVMEFSCSFNSIVGTTCSFDRRSKNKSIDIVPLFTCKKDIASHRSIWSFSGVESEDELILCRAGIFYAHPKDESALTVCPYHRSELGIGWRKSYNSCSVPEELAHHRLGKTKTVKGDRGIGKEVSKVILQRTGVLIPVGSGKNFTETFPKVMKKILEFIPHLYPSQ
jgi:hypothetical protein